MTESSEILINRLAKDLRVCTEGPWMLPVDTMIPTGSERGQVLVISVGGSTLRLHSVTITPNNAITSEILNTLLPEYVKSGNSLFQWIAEQLIPILDKWSEQYGSPLLAVSWSFPLLNGKVLSMGKSFDTDYVDKDLRTLFDEVLPVQYRVRSATHDGTSSLLAGMHYSSLCTMALTLGTGVNINLVTENNTLINTEISMLGREDTTPNIRLAKERFDIVGPLADAQPFEAQVGGMYLGIMVSNALKIDVTTPEVWGILRQRDDPRYEITDRIVTRAACLLAAVIYGVYFAYNPTRCKVHNIVEVAYTGSVIFEAEFRRRLEIQLKNLEERTSTNFILFPQRFGSEIGAAIAALTSQYQQ